jgi:predicted permease
MSILSSIRLRVATLFHRSQANAELEEELRSHIQQRADDLERSGVTRFAAERRARIEFGSYQRFREECHEAAGGGLVESLGQDLCFALRVLRKSPSFTAIAILTLALGIGATSVAFSLMNALIMRPLDVPHAQSLYSIERGQQKDPAQSYPDYRDLRDRTRSFDGIVAYTITRVGLSTDGHATGAWLYLVSGNYFDVLDIRPYLGRFFHSSDEHGENSAPYLVLSYSYWQNHFEGDRSIVGRTVFLNKHPFTILGVAPPSFHGTEMYFTPNFWVPLVSGGQAGGWGDLNLRASHYIWLVGRLKPGVTIAQATTDLNSVGTYLAENYPLEDRRISFSLTRPGLIGDTLGRPVRAFSTGLMSLALLILLAACANLGNLFAARAADRSREVALRLALGSSRRRILRQLMTEAMLISLTGGVLGLLGGLLALHWLDVWQPVPSFPVHLPVDPDARTYAAALISALVSAVLFGLVPVRQMLRMHPWHVVKSGTLNTSTGGMGLRDILLVLQVTVCGILITASFVAVRGLQQSLRSNYGFLPHHALLVETDLSMAGYDGDKAPAMQRRMLDTFEAMPGIDAVGLTDRMPLDGENMVNDHLVFKDTTTELRAPNAAAVAVVQNVSTNYFQAAGTALLTGRVFTRQDDAHSPRVAVVNRTFASKLFGSVEKAMGRYFKMADGSRVRVVGVAEDGKYKTIAEQPQPALFQPILQNPTNATWVVVRSNREPRELAAALDQKLRHLDPALPFTLRTWERELDGALFASRVVFVSLSMLGIFGAMLAVTGIFGMASYAVSCRLKELGIRIALGAQRREVLQTALGRALRLLAFGSAAGLVLGVVGSNLLAFIAYQGTARDPLVLCGVVTSMMFLGLVATWIPAARALSVDPLELLREE